MAYTGPPTKDAFEAASSWLSGNIAAAGLSNDIKLELYGIYKYVNIGQPTGGRPSIFHPTQRAKYDAWSTAHSKYSSLSGGSETRAMQRYIEIATSVGWKGEGIGQDDEEEIDFDAPSTSVEGDESKGGLGLKQSLMSVEDDEPSSGGTLHDAVIDNDIEEVRRLLSTNPEAVKATDDFGSTPLHMAVDRGHVEIVKLLMSSGADRYAKDDDEQTPLDIAKLLSRQDMIELLEQ